MDRTALTDCQDELHRLVRELNARQRYTSDLEQHISTLISLMHREHGGNHATFPYCERQVCKHTAELLGIEPKVRALKELVAEREFHRANGEEVDPR